jgi:ribonuclease HII
MLILGIDDAGRGPLIGPMILAGVLLTKTQETKIQKAGAKDSKLLSQTQRLTLAKLIKSNSLSHKTLSSSPKEIDESNNLNTLEAKKAAQIINELNDIKEKITVIVDCPSTNLLAWKNTMMSFVKHKENLTVKCEHKADFKYPSVSAASILAKVEREFAVSELRKKYGNIGSGYPSDPTTIRFLKEKGKEFSNEGIFRKSWATWKKMFPQDTPNQQDSSTQKKLFSSNF